MLVDYADTLTRLEQALGRRFAATPSICNVPGASAALKLDPFYYLVLRPAFFELLGKWAAVPPERVEDVLIRTGNLVCGPNRSRYPRPLVAFEEGLGATLQLHADFVAAACIDRALVMYGGAPGPLPVSDLRLAAFQKGELDAFFTGKTGLTALCFGEPGRV